MIRLVFMVVSFLYQFARLIFEAMRAPEAVDKSALLEAASGMLDIAPANGLRRRQLGPQNGIPGLRLGSVRPPRRLRASLLIPVF
jgi:hypothetical protein